MGPVYMLCVVDNLYETTSLAKILNVFITSVYDIYIYIYIVQYYEACIK